VDAETVSADFKAKVALEAIKGHDRRGASEQARTAPDPDYWLEREAVEKLTAMFDENGSGREQNRDAELTKLHAKIGASQTR
jgi:hypothetical protein